MEEILQVPVTQPQYILDQGVAFAQVDDWFGNATRSLKMDVIYPKPAKESYPCIVWICGGAFLQMNIGVHLPYLMELAKAGFVVASVEYRTSNQAQFPAPVCDIKSAVRYLKAHASRYAIDPQRFGVMGESAGGYLAAMTALTENLPEFDQGDYLEYSSAVQAACTWYLPSVLGSMVDQIPEHLRSATPESLLLGQDPGQNPELAKKASPVYYARKDAPPFLLIHGTEDHTVGVQHSQWMYQALSGCGADVSFLKLLGADHGDLQFFQQEVQSRIAGFFREKLRRRPEKAAAEPAK